MHGLSTGITFNGLEWPLTRISKSQHFSALNISETTRDRAIVTVERQCTLSNADIFNDLDRPLVRFSRSWHCWSRTYQKRCIIWTKLL